MWTFPPPPLNNVEEYSKKREIMKNIMHTYVCVLDYDCNIVSYVNVNIFVRIGKHATNNNNLLSNHLRNIVTGERGECWQPVICFSSHNYIPCREKISRKKITRHFFLRAQLHKSKYEWARFLINYWLIKKYSLLRIRGSTVHIIGRHLEVTTGATHKRQIVHM